jgi:hypothetical protein
VDRVSQRFASQRVKVEARKVQFLRCVNSIEAIKPQQNALMHLYIDLRRFALNHSSPSGLFLNVLITPQSRFAMFIDVSYLLTNVKQAAASRQAILN